MTFFPPPCGFINTGHVVGDFGVEEILNMLAVREENGSLKGRVYGKCRQVWCRGRYYGSSGVRGEGRNWVSCFFSQCVGPEAVSWVCFGEISDLLCSSMYS